MRHEFLLKTFFPGETSLRPSFSNPVVVPFAGMMAWKERQVSLVQPSNFSDQPQKRFAACSLGQNSFIQGYGLGDGNKPKHVIGFDVRLGRHTHTHKDMGNKSHPIPRPDPVRCPTFPAPFDFSKNSNIADPIRQLM